MTTGYVYILSNKSMPGLLKIGRTDRRPELRAKELTSATGVPAEFEIELTVLVSDSVAAERFIHQTLEKKGLRFSKNREFFNVSLEEAAELLRQVSTKDFSNISAEQLALNHNYLWERYKSIKLPGMYEKISEEHAAQLESKLWPIATDGLDYAYKALSLIFLENYPNQLT